MSIEIETTSDGLQADHEGVEAYLSYVQKRRSIRKLAYGPVADETIRTILEAGRWSPSSANAQPVRIIVVKERHKELWDFIEQTLKTKLQGERLERALKRLPGYRAGVFTLVFYEDTTIINSLSASVDAKMMKNFSIQAMGITQINVWNAIAAAGLATSNQHMNLQMEEELRAFLGVPATWESYSIFPVGYAAETPAEGVRRAHEEVVYYEHGPATEENA
ncbi:MAG: nitroreductase family protein [Ktedonobacteraceae bacterium]